MLFALLVFIIPILLARPGLRAERVHVYVQMQHFTYWLQHDSYLWAFAQLQMGINH